MNATTPAIRFLPALFALLLACTLTAHGQSKRFPGQLGAWPYREGESGPIKGTTFRVWAPNAESVAVTGTFNRWNDSRHRLVREKANGWWSLDVDGAKPGDEYLYVINGKLKRKDPRSRKVTDSAGNSVIYDPEAFDWSGDDFTSSASLKDLVIYQMHIGSFFDPDPTDGKPGTFRDAIRKLDHIKELGANAILLMPVNEFAGRHSWGYNPSDLFAIESAYGGPDGLKEFVKEAHRRGLAVHMDIVHNHYGPGDLHLYDFDGSGGGQKPGIYFYNDPARADTPWGPRPDFGQPQVRSFIRDNVRMWFDEYRIDGLRWDSTVNIRAVQDGAVVNPEGEDLLHRLGRMIRQEYPGKVNVAEDSVGDPRFDSSWEYGFHHSGDRQAGVVPQLVKPSDAARQVSDLASRIKSPLGFRRVIYSENHDETGKLNNHRRLLYDADPADPQSLTARRKAALAAVLTLTSPGIPLVFMGQELSEDKEFHDDHPLNWQRGPAAFHAFQLYRDLIRLRRNLDGRSTALTGTHTRVVKQDDDLDLLAYRRYIPGRPKDDIYVVVNASGETVRDRKVTFPQAGEWTLLVNTDDPKYGADFTGVRPAATRTDARQQIALSMAPYSAQIFGMGRYEPSQLDLAELREEWDETYGEPLTEESAAALAEAGTEEPPAPGPAAEPEPVPFRTEVGRLVVIANFTQPKPWDPENSSMTMHLVEDHIWQAEFGFANARNIQFKIMNPATGITYGGPGYGDGLIPVTGTALENGAPIPVAGPLDGDYILSFNEKTLRFRFERRAASSFGRVNLMADFNGWSRNADPLHMIADHTWQAEVDLEKVPAIEFVFLADGSLEKQWGDDAPSASPGRAKGTAVPLAQTIKVAGPFDGLVRFTFNEATGEYSVEALEGRHDRLPPVPAPQPVNEIPRVPAKPAQP